MQDHKKELMLIQELMDKLIGEMEPSASDFETRLGREKPEIKAIEIEGVLPEEGEELEMEEEMDMDEDMDDMDSEMGMEEETPEESLKKRLMKLRG